MSPKADSPKKKPANKADQPAGKDIRGFNSQKTGITKQVGTKSGSGKKPIMIDDSDEEPEKVLKEQLSSKVAPPSSASNSTTSKHFGYKAIVLSSDEEPVPAGSISIAKSAPKVASKSIMTIKPALAKRKLLNDSESEEEGYKPQPKRRSLGGRAGKESDGEGTKSTKKGKRENDDDFDDDDEEYNFDDEDELQQKPKPKSTAKKPLAAPMKSTPVKEPAAPKTAKTAEPEKKEEKKFDWRAAAAARAAGPKAPGSKEIPEGTPDCLAGLTFVFTGEMESLGREDAQELVRRYSGKVTTAPSGKTSYVVVGENAGVSKLNKVKEKKIPMINEDEFLELIRQRSGKGPGGTVDKAAMEKASKAREKEEKKILEQAKEMEEREKKEEKERIRKQKALEGQGMAVKKTGPASAQLWTTKYAPTSLKEICGNKAPVERLGQWLKDWQNNYKANFKKPGKDGMGVYRAVLISGPPGIGKTTSAHLMAKEAGYTPLELNASDTRSKKLIENETNVDNKSLDGFFKGQGIGTNAAGLKIGSRTCLIMDEVDGMSAGDRGGVGALNTLIRKTKIPMILICNDRTLQKMKPLQSTTFNMTFRRPQPNEIRSRIMSILHKEKLKIPPNVVDELIKGVNSDIRQVLNMLSTFKLGKSEMNFDEGKQLVKVNEKNTIMTPFTIIDKLTGPYAFSKNSKETLNDRIELYFHDFSFVPLFMQEHYLKTNPTALNNLDGPEKNLKHLELVSKAADSISDGDLIDRMIHGSEQHWSLLPLHAVASTVKPAMQVYGAMRSQGGGWGSWGPAFPQWLGQNSKQNKLQRQLTDIQIRMRLRVSGSREEIREQYMPLLASKIVSPLIDRGAAAVEETIEYMDEYYLGKDDWDAFVELGVDTMRDEDILKKIPSATKASFTRQYNKTDHPIAFHKGDLFAGAKKKIDVGPVPDNEDVFEEDEPVPDEPEEDKSEEEDPLQDKLIKAVKPKGKATAKSASKPTVSKGAKSKAMK
ncbi:replication factor C subunit 1 [Cryptococcus bacillisporus CA1873]|uniref:Replication factor C subunit 1 n=1 Tax=Cryptococcus bacillisporus CA1873 TaxID=1296111 RepID=A0ABR5BBE9_CRYGA|nr:replication factor C subunit 1 [Cryptococcus bacillisporus CA1873]|eukprot:KIR63639.1 replication factor C subunit 1 [Cryptococcus gattii CA1873]